MSSAATNPVRDERPCWCGASTHGTGAHEKLVRLELEDLELRVDQLVEQLEQDIGRRLVRLKARLELLYELEDEDADQVAELERRRIRLDKCYHGELHGDTTPPLTIRSP